ncbi:MAG: hypothetical protein ACPLRW_07905 [Moorellales bacterium]
MARKRKIIKVEQKPNYVVEDYKNPPEKDIIGYRRVKTKSGHIINVAILKKKGPRGGRTVATSLWHPKSEKRTEKAARKRKK